MYISSFFPSYIPFFFAVTPVCRRYSKLYPEKCITILNNNFSFGSKLIVLYDRSSWANKVEIKLIISHIHIRGQIIKCKSASISVCVVVVV